MLTQWLLELFVRDRENTRDPVVRLRYGMLSGAVGIAVNLLLVAIKGTAAILSGSIALGADAVNNLSDAGSSIITLSGFKMSAKPADNEHPFGHGRIEYVSALIVATIITAVGINFFKEAVVRIFSPSALLNDWKFIVLVAGTMLFKVWLFLFYRRVGGKIDSEMLKAQAFDSLSDLISTGIVLAGLILSRYTAFPVDGVAGVAVAVFIVWGGVKLLTGAANLLLGAPPDAEFVEKLRRCLVAQKGIRGVHDIIMHNYGPDLYFATAHAEVDHAGDLVSMHDILESAEVAVARELPIRLTLHCDPFSNDHPLVKKWRIRLENAVASYDPVFKVYDFRVDEKTKTLHFHLLTPRTYCCTNSEICDALTAMLVPYDPDVKLAIQFVYAYV
ncbi:MAG: cation diffusion facilitator family transporter [Victivallaceae bacterium]|nr:cation diffusion facilitator family transporter [Victivallaceae bacterium]